MKRDILNSPRLLEIKKRRRKFFFRKLTFLIVGLVLLFGIFTYVSSLSKLNISSIEIVGNKITDTEDIKSVVNENLAGKYLWLFPKSNLFFYPKKEIKLALAENFKRLNNINLSIQNGNVLEVSTDERKGLYVWCGASATQTEAEENCYFMDESGYIFDKAPYFSGEVYFKFYGEVSDSISPSGFYFEEADFSRLIALKEMLAALHVEPVALYKMEDGDIKIYLSDKSGAPMGPEILLKIDSDFKKVVENLQSALATEPLLSQFKNKYSSLLYIDLRFGNKVYYKFK